MSSILIVHYYSFQDKVTNSLDGVVYQTFWQHYSFRNALEKVVSVNREKMQPDSMKGIILVDHGIYLLLTMFFVSYSRLIQLPYVLSCNVS